VNMAASFVDSASPTLQRVRQNRAPNLPTT